MCDSRFAEAVSNTSILKQQETPYTQKEFLERNFSGFLSCNRQNVAMIWSPNYQEFVPV